MTNRMSCSAGFTFPDEVDNARQDQQDEPPSQQNSVPTETQEPAPVQQLVPQQNAD